MRVLQRLESREQGKEEESLAMSDWGPVFVAVVLFVVLSPGLLFQLPSRERCLDFANFQTSAASILVHSLLYFCLISIALLAFKVHVYLGS